MEVILLSGPPGCGKSTLADLIAKKLKIFVLDKDCIDESFSPGQRGRAYTRDIEPKILGAMLTLARRNIGLGVSFILDVPWTHIMINEPRWVSEMEQLTSPPEVRLTIFELKIESSLLKVRLQARGLDRDQVKFTKDGWKNFAEIDCIDELNPMPHHVLDASLSAEQLLECCLKHLRPT